MPQCVVNAKINHHQHDIFIKRQNWNTTDIKYFIVICRYNFVCYSQEVVMEHLEASTRDQVVTVVPHPLDNSPMVQHQDNSLMEPHQVF